MPTLLMDVGSENAKVRKRGKQGRKGYGKQLGKGRGRGCHPVQHPAQALGPTCSVDTSAFAPVIHQPWHCPRSSVGPHGTAKAMFPWAKEFFPRKHLLRKCVPEDVGLSTVVGRGPLCMTALEAGVASSICDIPNVQQFSQGTHCPHDRGPGAPFIHLQSHTI